jgi:MarR family 2-MHQ and catechol resistance regulon transcriptional repressor
MMIKTAPAKRTPAQDRALKLFVVLSRAVNAIHDRLSAHSDGHELTPTEFGILEALHHKGPLLLGEVQKKILKTSGGVTYTVDRLVEKGLVERQACPSDRRARYAVLTPRGSALMHDIFPSYAEYIEALCAGLSAREQEEVTSLLRKLGLHAAGTS